MDAEARCPYCAEPMNLVVDVSGGRRQHYVEDCWVCCRPVDVRVRVAQGDVEIEVRGADEAC